MSRYGSLRKFLLALAVFAIVGVAAGTAKADIVVVTGVNNQVPTMSCSTPQLMFSPSQAPLAKTICWSTLHLQVAADC